MPVRFLSDAELARLSSWPDEIAEHDLVTFFTLTSDDAAWLSGNVRVENRLGAAVQLGTLPWLGWIPDDLTGCPSAAVSRLGTHFGLAPDDLPDQPTIEGERDTVAAEGPVVWLTTAAWTSSTPSPVDSSSGMRP